VKLGIVGCGNIAPRYARTIANADGLELVAATDVIPERADELVAEFGGRSRPSLDALLADGDVEAVVNLTGAVTHASVTTAALEAGKHVHTEKPMALTYADARDLADLASARGLVLSCSPATLLGEAQQTAWKLVREGAIGTPRVVYAEANWGRIEVWHPSPLTLYDAGPAFDVGVYPLTIATAMFGPARRVVAYARTLLPDRPGFRLETPDFVVAVVELESGVVVRLTASFYVGPGKQRGLEIHGDDGMLHLAEWAEFDSRLELGSSDGKYERVELVRDPYRGTDWSRALVELANAVDERRVPRIGAQHAAHVVEILCGTAESAERGAPVDVHSSFEPPPPMEWAS
jgi:predicted dehydrogenase